MICPQPRSSPELIGLDRVSHVAAALSALSTRIRACLSRVRARAYQRGGDTVYVKYSKTTVLYRVLNYRVAAACTQELHLRSFTSLATLPRPPKKPSSAFFSLDKGRFERATLTWQISIN